MNNENYKHTDHYIDNDYEKPKELFKFIGNIIDNNLKDEEPFSLLDVGCAKGEFIYYIKNRFSKNTPSLHGIDYSKSLIDKASNFPDFSDVSFSLADAESFKLNKKFDCIVATGLISYFDDYELFIDNLLKHLNENGTIIITNGFSTSDYDVMLKFRKYDNKDEFDTGWNQHSINGLKKYISNKAMSLIQHKFELPFELTKGDDLLRSWTLNTSDGQKFVNGLNQIWNLWSLEIR